MYDERLFRRPLYITRHLYSRLCPVFLQHRKRYSCLFSTRGASIALHFTQSFLLCSVCSIVAVYHVLCPSHCVQDCRLCTYAPRFFFVADSACHARGRLHCLAFFLVNACISPASHQWPRWSFVLFACWYCRVADLGAHCALNRALCILQQTLMSGPLVCLGISEWLMVILRPSGVKLDVLLDS